MKIDHTEITVRLMNEDFTAKYLQENAELIQATIEATTKALSKSSVSQQRELLIAYEKYKDGWTDESESDRINFMVDSYLRNL